MLQGSLHCMPMNRSTAKELMQAAWWKEEPITRVETVRMNYSIACYFFTWLFNHFTTNTWRKEKESVRNVDAITEFSFIILFVIKKQINLKWLYIFWNEF